jgi:hypothetical protein
MKGNIAAFCQCVSIATTALWALLTKKPAVTGGVYLGTYNDFTGVAYCASEIRAWSLLWFGRWQMIGPYIF